MSILKLNDKSNHRVSPTICRMQSMLALVEVPCTKSQAKSQVPVKQMEEREMSKGTRHDAIQWDIGECYVCLKVYLMSVLKYYESGDTGRWICKKCVNEIKERSKKWPVHDAAVYLYLKLELYILVIVFCVNIHKESMLMNLNLIGNPSWPSTRGWNE